MSVEELYPFLYADTSDVEAVLAEVRRSTAEKAAEIVALRTEFVEQQGEALEAAAAAMAAGLAGGGKLFTFGNGGSATDAAGAADLFRHPPHGRPLPAVSLVDDPAVLTALANDVGFE
ncbi:MAG: SIS domain-containing protein, partial [Acidimicrobiia bacterium]